MKSCYGLHLILRIKDLEKNLSLNDSAVISDFLVSLVGRLKMRILAGPLVEIEEGSPEKSGCSGVVILYESHAAIHTYPFLKEAFIDIFSCKVFEDDIVLNIIRDYFGPYQVAERTLLQRGTHWSASIMKEMQNWQIAR